MKLIEREINEDDYQEQIVIPKTRQTPHINSLKKAFIIGW